MGVFDRVRRRTATSRARGEEVDAVREHLRSFVTTRTGVEAYIEPSTSVTPPTVVLVATTGEWTRRRLLDPGLLRELSDSLAVPVYDVQLTGYPQRMRAWTSAKARETDGRAT